MAGKKENRAESLTASILNALLMPLTSNLATNYIIITISEKINKIKKTENIAETGNKFYPESLAKCLFQIHPI